jgi:hypothetical protein
MQRLRDLVAGRTGKQVEVPAAVRQAVEELPAGPGQPSGADRASSVAAALERILR